MNRRNFLAAVAASPVMPAAVRAMGKSCEHHRYWNHVACRCENCGTTMSDLWKVRIEDWNKVRPLDRFYGLA